MMYECIENKRRKVGGYYKKIYTRRKESSSDSENACCTITCFISNIYNISSLTNTVLTFFLFSCVYSRLGIQQLLLNLISKSKYLLNI